MEDLYEVSTGAGANLLGFDRSPVSGSVFFLELLVVVSTGCGRNRLGFVAFKSPVSGSFLAVLELLVVVSTGSGANRLALGFSSCASPLSFEDLEVVSTGVGANLRGGGEDIVVEAEEVKGVSPEVKCEFERACVGCWLVRGLA